MGTRTKEGIAAASATYRKATNEVASRLRVEAEHTKYPKDDFMRIAGRIDENSKRRALAFYELGLRRGLRRATDLFADRTIRYRKGAVEAPARLKVNVRIKFSGSQWQSRSFTIKTKDIGFK